MPSPLRSATCVTAQFPSDITVAVLVAAMPFMSQTAVCPVALLRQRMSVLPSPLKSPTFATDQSGLV